MASLKRVAPETRVFDYDRVKHMTYQAKVDAILDYICTYHDNHALIADLLIKIKRDYSIKDVVFWVSDKELKMLLAVLNSMQCIPDFDPEYDCQLDAPEGIQVRDERWQDLIRIDATVSILMFRIVKLRESFEDCIKWMDILLGEHSGIRSPFTIMQVLVQIIVPDQDEANEVAIKLIRYVCLMSFMTSSLQEGPRRFRVDETNDWGVNNANLDTRSLVLLNLLNIEDVETFVICVNNLFEQPEGSMAYQEAGKLLDRAISWCRRSDSLSRRLLHHIFLSKTSKPYQWLKQQESNENYWRLGAKNLHEGSPDFTKSFLKHFNALKVRTKDLIFKYDESRVLFEKEHTILSLCQGVQPLYNFDMRSIEQAVKELIKKGLAKVIIVKIILIEFEMIYSDSTLQSAWKSMITDLVTKETIGANSLTRRMDEMKLSDEPRQRHTQGMSRRGIL